MEREGLEMQEIPAMLELQAVVELEVMVEVRETHLSDRDFLVAADQAALVDTRPLLAEEQQDHHRVLEVLAGILVEELEELVGS